MLIKSGHFVPRSQWIENVKLKLRCDERFTHAFTACGCVFKEITLVGSNQGNYFENATACSKRTLKTIVATQLKEHLHIWFPHAFSAFRCNFLLLTLLDQNQVKL